MDLHQAMESGAGMNQGYGGMQQSSGPPTDDHQQMNVARNLLEELKAERNSLDPSFVHCIRWLDQEIEKSETGSDPNHKQSEKIYIPFLDQKKYNLVGRLLGPKGLTLKRIQAETNTKMSILGRGSMRDKQKEEELRTSSDPTYKHLNDDLHVLIEAIPPHTTQKVAAGVAEVKKMLIPVEPGQPDFASKYENAPPPGYAPMGGGRGPPMSSRRPPMGGRGGPRGGGGMGGPRGGRGGGGRGGPRGRGRGGPSQGRGPPPPRSHPAPPPPQPGPDTYTRDYNHGYDTKSDTMNSSYGSDSFGGGNSYYSSFSDAPQDGGNYGGGGGPSRTPRRDYRHHPYPTQGVGGGGGYF